MKKFPRKPKPFHLTNNDIIRFESFVIKTDSKSCWLWKGGCCSIGYGNFKAGGRTLSAHRVAYQIAYGKPKGYVCHKCDNRKCCNPKHLYDGDNIQNMEDCTERKRRPYGQRNGKVKLTNKQVLTIARLKKAGLGIVAVTKKMKLPMGTVSNVYYGYAWTHLTKIK